MSRVGLECYDLDTVAESDLEGRWEQILSTTHVASSVRLGSAWGSGRRPSGFRASARRAWIDDLALVDASCDPCRGASSRAQAGQGDDDYVVMLLNRGGREVVAQDGRSTQMRPGDVVVWDSTRPITFDVIEPLTKRSLFVPRAALREVGAGAVDVSGAVIARGSASTELLAGYLDVLARTIDRLTPAAVASARNATLNLVAAALDPGKESDRAYPVGSPELRARIDQWIDQNLDRVDLNAATIAVEHHLSVRTVHRVFERSGDRVGTVIRARRLARARHELVTTDDPITAIAARWQFYDLSHFTRAFRARYGLSPGRYRAEPAIAS